MQIIPAKTPGFIKTLFPNFVWNINTTKKELYLTFDDGPTPEITDWVLQILEKYDAKATFFCIGKNIEKHPGIFKQIIFNGHSIGNHTYNHLKGWKHKTKVYYKDILSTEKIIGKFEPINASPLFRPPYGKFKTKQSKILIERGYRIILWDVLSYDWDKSVKKEECLNNVISAAKEGSIIVFHDSVKASQNLEFTLPKVLEHYTNLGYTFKAIN